MAVITWRDHDEAVHATQEALRLSSSQYHQTVVLVGLTAAQVGVMASVVGGAIVTVSAAMAGRLIEEPARSRSRAATEVLRQVIAERPGQPVLLDRIEVLFEPSLRLDPLALLKQFSRDRPIIVAWPGRLEGENLVYAEPWHPEHCHASAKDLMVVSANEQNTTP